MKFRVGDKVRVIKKGSHMQEIGAICKILKVDTDGTYYASCPDGNSWWFNNSHIELVEKRFTVNDLQEGDKCTLKRGDVIYYNKGIYEPSYNFYNLNKELEYETNDKVSIVKVERPVKYETVFERKEEILDETEKRYLANVIRPFRDKVTRIKKCSRNTTESHIRFLIKNDADIVFPNFETNTMYQGMETGKKYTLEELGL